MRRRAAAPGPVTAPPRRLVEPWVEDFVQPGEALDHEDVHRAPQPVDLTTRAGMVEAAAAQRLSDARHSWTRDHPGSTALLPIHSGRVWAIGAWRPDDEHRSGVGTSAPQWRDRAAWLAADESRVPW